MSPTPPETSIIFGSPSILRVLPVSHLLALPNLPVCPEFLQLPEFYPAPDLLAELTLPESPENLEVRYVRELLNLQQRREIHQVARTAKRPELYGSDAPNTLDDKTFDTLQ